MIDKNDVTYFKLIFTYQPKAIIDLVDERPKMIVLMPDKYKTMGLPHDSPLFSLEGFYAFKNASINSY